MKLPSLLAGPHDVTVQFIPKHSSQKTIEKSENFIIPPIGCALVRCSEYIFNVMCIKFSKTRLRYYQ